MAHITANTEKYYPCLMCGAPGNIIRESPDPRLKCTSCSFLYDASASLAAQEANEIPDGKPKLQENVVDSTAEEIDAFANKREPRDIPTAVPAHVSKEFKKTELVKASSALPRTPSYMIIARDRSNFELITKRELKKKLLKWEASEAPYDLYELTQKKINARIDIS